MLEGRYCWKGLIQTLLLDGDWKGVDPNVGAGWRLEGDGSGVVVRWRLEGEGSGRWCWMEIRMGVAIGMISVGGREGSGHSSWMVEWMLVPKDS